MRNLLTAWQNNPVIVNELRRRMRGRRAFLVLTAHLIILSGLVFIMYLSVYQDTQMSNNYYYTGSFQRMLEASSLLGKVIFYGTALLLLFVVSLIGPAFTAGSIVSEKDHQTYDLLVMTTLSARQIVLGKLYAVLVFMGLLVLATLPFQTMAYFLGGIAPLEIALAVLLLLLTTLLFCSLGMFVSSVARSATIANILNYTFVIPMLLGVPFFAFITAILSSGLFFERVFSDPPYLVGAVLSYLILFFISINPLSMAVMSEIFLQETGNYFFSVEEFFGHKIPIPAPWIIFAVFSLAVSFIFISAAIGRVNRVSRQ